MTKNVELTNTGGVLNGLNDNTTSLTEKGLGPLLDGSRIDNYANSLYNSAMRKSTVDVGQNGPTQTDIIGAPFNGENGSNGLITIKRMRDDAHEKYSQGDLMFLHKKSTEWHNDNETTAVALWNLNAGLEERARIHRSDLNTQYLSGSVQQMIEQRKRSRDSSLDGGIFPRTLEQFLSEWTFIGVVESQNSKIGPSSKATNNRLLAIKYEGTNHDITNLWPGANIGDRVGFLYKEVPNRFDRFYGIDGDVKGEATSGSYLQVIPWVQNGKDNYKFPASSSQFLEPKPKDRDFITESIVDQYSYGTDDLGLIDINKKSEKKSFISNDYKQGFYLQIGIVTHVRRHTQDERIINLATRTHSFNRQLKNIGTISLYLTPLGHLPTRC